MNRYEPIKMYQLVTKSFHVSTGRRILVATTGIVSGTSLINSVAGGLQPDPAAKEAGSS